METLLEELFYKYRRADGKYTDLEYTHRLHRISSNSGYLKKNFTKAQKRLLLRIIDDKDWIAETESSVSFADGVKLGVKLMAEIFHSRQLPPNYFKLSPHR